MRELINQSLSGIRDIIPEQNYGFIKARLDQLLPKEVASSFAKIQILGKDGIWYAENNLSYRTYSEASDLEKEEIAIELEMLKEIAFAKLIEEMPYWGSLFVVPNQDCIFWNKDKGKMHVVLAAWGFDIRTTEKQVNVISEIITAPRPLTQIPVVLSCKFTNGEQASEYEFNLLIFNNRKVCKTDAAGKYTIGSLFADKTFAVEDVNGKQHQEFTVKKDATYEPVFEVLTSYELLIVNQDDEPLVNYNLEVNGDLKVTDEEGVIRDTDIILYPDSKIIVSNQDNLLGEFELNIKPENNQFKVVVTIEKVTPKKVTIKLEDNKGKSLPNLTFTIKAATGSTIIGTTNENGIAVFPAEKFEKGKKYNIYFDLSAEYQKELSNTKEGGKS
jgi:hypothetical protein